jgi:hypothetical protein
MKVTVFPTEPRDGMCLQRSTREVKLNFGFSAQAGPYPQTNHIRMPKNRSPPPRSRSRSASTTSEPNHIEVNSSHAKSSNGRRSRLHTTNRRVHFIPEVDNEQAADPKDDAIAGESPARKLPATQTTHGLRSDKRSPSRIPGTSPGHTTPTASGSASIQRFPPEEAAGAIEETSSGESEVPDDRGLATVQTPVHSQRDDSIRSGIRDLLEANRKVRMVDANTANILESLLSQMNRDSGDRLVLSPSSVQINDPVFRALASPGPADAPSRVRTGARFVGRLNPKPLLLTTYLVAHRAKRHPPQHGLSADFNLLQAKEKPSGGRAAPEARSQIRLTT